MFEVRNYGNSRKVPHDGMFVEIGKKKTIRTNDQSLALRLAEYPYIDILWPKKSSDQMKFKRQHLLKWATSLKLRDHFFDDKETLTKKISAVLTPA